MIPALAAAARLLAILPVSTHHQRSREDYTPAPSPRSYTRRQPHLRGAAGISRPVRVGKRVFRSITEAKTRLKVSPKTLYEWLDSGKATYEKGKK